MKNIWKDKLLNGGHLMMKVIDPKGHPSKIETKINFWPACG